LIAATASQMHVCAPPCPSKTATRILSVCVADVHWINSNNARKIGQLDSFMMGVI